jgi:hypothetical protein
MSYKSKYLDYKNRYLSLRGSKCKTGGGKFDDVEQLKRRLNADGIHFDQWGKQDRHGRISSKTVEQLFKEYESRDCELIDGPVGLSGTMPKLLRKVVNVYAYLVYGGYYVKEKQQQYFDKASKMRISKDRDMVVAEKQNKDDDGSWERTLYRGLKEELGLDSKDVRLVRDSLKVEEISKDSYSYPGLQTRFQNYHVKVYLLVDQLEDQAPRLGILPGGILSDFIIPEDRGDKILVTTWTWQKWPDKWSDPSTSPLTTGWGPPDISL